MASAGPIIHDGRTIAKQVFADKKNNFEVVTEYIKTPGGTNGL
jgi:hypothetical protein